MSTVIHYCIKKDHVRSLPVCTRAVKKIDRWAENCQPADDRESRKTGPAPHFWCPKSNTHLLKFLLNFSKCWSSFFLNDIEMRYSNIHMCQSIDLTATNLLAKIKIYWTKVIKSCQFTTLNIKYYYLIALLTLHTRSGLG